ncbi:DUF397 domain-containing protein [Streptomyces capitiformicae]|uniref:DUF397 domain-containing protein n=1 Tax=Streptomyces capitiformicae TaxID=2014920 RepID=A0A919GMV4_9ACTN|nr:DUF397 domain-containing protein [Streptomyces capitiformicae]GHH87411.1 hypothetical protein GCM10017771_28450 [Streptomyces capitiformicae]
MDHAPHWQKSTFSDGGDGNTCVELAAISLHLVGLRESDTPATVLATTHTSVTHLLHHIKAAR